MWDECWNQEYVQPTYLRHADSGCGARTDAYRHAYITQRAHTAQRHTSQRASRPPRRTRRTCAPRSARRPRARRRAVQRHCSARSRETTTCHARARSSKPAAVGHRWPTTAGRPSMVRPLGAAALPSRGLDGGRDARVCEHASRDALRLSGRPRAAHAMGREAASESHGRGRLSGTQQPKDARLRQGRRPGGQTHTSFVSSVAGLPLNSDLASVDSKFTSLLQLLVGPATRPERAHPNVTNDCARTEDLQL